MAIGERHRVSPRPDHATLYEFQRELRIDFPAALGTMGAMAEPTPLHVHDDEGWRGAGRPESPPPIESCIDVPVPIS